MSKLEELIEMCKCEVSVVVNEHTVYYEDLKEYLETRDTELIDIILEDRGITL